ncbi:MAG: bifunctional proline dehydrogenase/L-glutamate gamma-semialdehyde dehydrogenase [Gammaproteobacteria bacterium RIFCSPHIGHO2_12_FULL_41_20]|nr:MAG: bifunctional proline dehydrogenase/L-glutamate gamma-semialdehyde dehydrogenase [Gammaproteobacteria bacterium RIFCSPHIGHO2_12_FULL_41_20]
MLHINSLREAITHAYHMDEAACINHLLPAAQLPDMALTHITDVAQQLVIAARKQQKQQGPLNAFLHQYDLSSEEGIALMCMAEALLRIPDTATMDKLITDKIATVDWKTHIASQNTFFINAATWSLLFTGKVFAPTLDNEKNLASSLARLISRVGISMIRPLILQGMKAIGKQFVMGETIETALKRAHKVMTTGYHFSFDMLGEAARTAQHAEQYFQSYVHAIDILGKSATSTNPAENPGISIKLSALHPRYEFAKQQIIFSELFPRLLQLAQQAKSYHLGLTIDAEEADRLDMSLDIFEKLYTDPSLCDWDGLGLAVQAYQKRAFLVIDWIQQLAKTHNKCIMLRLVKGAYWDYEIKHSQLLGLENYPVFTRKHATDVSYLACVKKLLAYSDYIYPQFGTHNAYCIAAILEQAQPEQQFEFQCLHGMGNILYDQIVAKNLWNKPCRIYAPVGTHKDLLGYLVRRLLENGANSSFLNQLADDKTPIEKVTINPVARIAALSKKPHPHIPLPRNIYQQWLNSTGIDLSNSQQWTKLKHRIELAEKTAWTGHAIIAGNTKPNATQPLVSPGNTQQCIGQVSDANLDDVADALTIATAATAAWGATPAAECATLLEKVAALFEQAMPEFISLLCSEGGKCIPDCLSEVREAIDFCRYYAYRARLDLLPQDLPSCTGEANQLSLHPRGVIVCISPWNFPLAIFIGQIVAALVTGNTVIAKPAEQTPLIAHAAIRLLHQAGIPKEAVQLLPGKGEIIGAKLVADERVAGVMFTGSTETAKHIQKTLAERNGPIVQLIAETGGLNAMIVDSSALPEQCIMDIMQSAFNSAGQRCSALRVLFLQEDIADTFLDMLKGAMAELKVGDPAQLDTDIGPVIDNDALQMLQQHATRMHQEAKFIYQVPLPTALHGYYFAPCVFEIANLQILKREVFGPILHVIRYPANQLHHVMETIVQTGYGLTLGIHSRIDTTVKYIASHMPVGNVYINRNMIGAVVGVQPFGGERLSGTGPKAGGPHYLPRLCVERAISVNTAAAGGNARLVSLREEELS